MTSHLIFINKGQSQSLVPEIYHTSCIPNISAKVPADQLNTIISGSDSINTPVDLDVWKKTRAVAFKDQVGLSLVKLLI